MQKTALKKNEDRRKQTIKVSKWWRDQATRMALVQQKQAVAPYSDVLVGAAIIASHNLTDELTIIGGCNIEMAEKENVHAERWAMARAVEKGYAFPHEIFITSQSKDEDAALCLDCRKLFMKINPKLHVVILNPDGSTKLDLELEKDLVPHAYKGKQR